jgi:hypothetical protein
MLTYTSHTPTVHAGLAICRVISLEVDDAYVEQHMHNKGRSVDKKPYVTSYALRVFASPARTYIGMRT